MSRVAVTATTLADLTAVTITPTTGLTVATSDDIEFDNNGDVFLVLHNADAGAHTVDIIAQGSFNGVATTTHQESVAAGATVLVGAFNIAALNTAGKVQVNFETGEEEHLYYKLIKFRYL